MFATCIAMTSVAAMVQPSVALNFLLPEPQRASLAFTSLPTITTPLTLASASSRRAWLGTSFGVLGFFNHPVAATAGQRTEATLDRVENYEAPKVRATLIF
jgi:hypothetical protein